MSYVNTFTVNTSIDWRQTSNINETYIIEQGDIDNTNIFTSGTGNSQVNVGYFLEKTLSSGENFQVDLSNLEQSIFHQTYYANLTGTYLKFLYIENKNTGAGQDLFVCATGTSGLTHPFGYGYLGFYIKPAAAFMITDRNTGYLINTGNRYFNIQDISGQSVQFNMAIFGVQF